MLVKSLVEEQTDMRQRWADPAYRWQNDSEIRRRYSKEFRHDGHKPEIPSRVQSTSEEVNKGTRRKSTPRKEGAKE
jgi:hypothetical protein